MSVTEGACPVCAADWEWGYAELRDPDRRPADCAHCTQAYDFAVNVLAERAANFWAKPREELACFCRYLPKRPHVHSVPPCPPTPYAPHLSGVTISVEPS
jgi:hypothetical protein